MAENHSDRQLAEEILNKYTHEDCAQILWTLWGWCKRDPEFVQTVADAIKERESAETLAEAMEIIRITL